MAEYTEHVKKLNKMSEHTEGGACFHQEVKQTYNQKYIMYNNMKKDELIRMLIECNKHIENGSMPYQRHNVIVDVLFTDGSITTYSDVLTSGIIYDKKEYNQFLEIEQSRNGKEVAVTIDMKYVKEYKIYDNIAAYDIFKEKERPKDLSAKDMILNKYTTGAILFALAYIMLAGLR